MGSIAGIKRTTLPQPSAEHATKALCINTIDSVVSKEHFQELIARFRIYFTGQYIEFPDKLNLAEATAFQREVWEAARQIPYGETRSYGWIARKIDKPSAARAVGQALGKNPLPIIIPCHRVLKSDGSLGGFGGGLEMKKRLLKLEKASI